MDVSWLERDMSRGCCEHMIGRLYISGRSVLFEVVFWCDIKMLDGEERGTLGLPILFDFNVKFGCM
jgi:hypothetical protein